MAFKSFAELRQLADGQRGIITVMMRDLRNLHGAGKLGTHVCAEIAGHLKGVGLAHYPSPLPESQDSQVRLYVEDSSIGRVLAAARFPGKRLDNVIRENFPIDSVGVLTRAREIVKDLSEVLADKPQ